MRKFIFYFIPFSVIILFLPKLDLFSGSIILLLVFHMFLQIGAIISISREDILYSKREKVFRTMAVVFIPIVGIFMEYYTYRKYSKKRYDNTGAEDTVTGGAGYFTGFGSGMMSFGGSGDSSGGGD